jgi:hypothetical protein
MSVTPANQLVRSNYLAVTICAPLLVALPAGFTLNALVADVRRGWPTILMIVLLATGLYLLPGLRAIRRGLRHGTVIAPALVSRRPVSGFVVTFFGVIGHFFFIVTMSMAIAIALAPEWPEEAKKIVGPLALGLFSYLIALWCGELALARNGQSDEGRASGSAAL